MKDEHKIKEQLTNESVEMRQRVAELEGSETERKRAQEAVWESERRYRLLAEHVTDVIWTMDMDLRFTYFSPSVTDLLGYSVEEAMAQTLEEVLTPASLEVSRKTLAEALAVAEPKDLLELELNRKDGSTVWTEVKMAFLHDPDGRPVGILAVARDITERKGAEQALRRAHHELEIRVQERTADLTKVNEELRIEIAERKRAEEALRESEAKYSALVEQAKDGVVIVQDGICKFANRATAETFGYAVEEIVGLPFLDRVAPESKDLIAQRYKLRVAGEEVPPVYEARIQCKDGTTKDVGISAGIIQYQGRPADMAIVRDITERKRAEEALRRERDLAEALEEATAALTATLDFDQVLDRILEQVSRVVPNDATNIMLIEGDQARVVRWRGYGRFGEKEFVSAVVFRIPEVPGLQQMMESGEPTVIPDTATYPGWVRVPVTEWLRSYAAAPIIVRGEVIGFLNVDSATPGFFTQAHAETLRAFADHAAAAIENARLYEAEQERRHIAETLRQASTVLNSTLELDEVLRLILQQLRQVIPYDSASVQRLQDAALSLPKREHLKIVACQGFEEPDKVVGLVFPLDPKFPNYRVVRTKAPLAIQDVTQDYPHFKDEADTYESGRIRSWLGVPLMVKDEVIGMIAVDREEVHPYTAEEAQLAMAFANQAAIAVENARLFEEEKRRSTQVALINEVGEKAASILDLDRLMQEVTCSIQESFNYYNVALLLVDKERREVVMRAVAGGFEHGTTRRFRQSLDEGIIGFVARTGKSWLANDTSKDPYYVKGFVGEVLTKSELCVPIKLGDEVIGALDVQSIDLNAFDQEDVAAMEVVADRLAIGIQNARLYEEMAGLYDVGLAVTSALELDKTLKAIYEQVNRLISPDTFYVALYDEARAELRFEIFVEESEWLPKFARKLDEGGLTASIVQSKKPLFIGNLEKERESLPAVPGQVGKPGIRSWLGLPLLARDKVVGVISVQSFRPHAFTEEDKRMLSGFANQAAVGIENARLYEAEQRRRREAETLRQAGAALTETLSLNDALETILEQLQQVVPYDSASVMLVSDGVLHVMAARGFPDIERTMEVAIPLADDPLFQEMLRTRRPVILTNAQKDERFLAAGETTYVRGWIGVPLVVKGRVIGNLTVDSRMPGAYGQEEAEMVAAFANQAAIAIENARLYEEIKERRMYLEGVLGAAPDAIVTLDARHRIVEWNSGAERLFGYSREEAISRDLDHLVTNPDTFEEGIGFTHIVMSGKDLPPVETVRYRKDGSPVDVIVAGSPILVGDELIGVVAVYTDITERKRMEETLRALSLIDELTGLYNRRGFFNLAEQQLKMADRTKRRMLLVFADFDHLKRINDALGHREGDLALIEVANVLKETFRESDIIARIGGDEFVVLPIETDSASAEILTTRLQENLRARNAEGGRRYKLSLSVGIARYDPESPCSIDALLAEADRAMYEQKQGEQKS